MENGLAPLAAIPVGGKGASGGEGVYRTAISLVFLPLKLWD